MPPTTIESLPAEILDYIIELACCDLNDISASKRSRRTRRARGLVFALVARRWTWKTQSTVWLEVDIGSKEEAESFFESDATGKHPTRFLSLTYWDRDLWKAEEILEQFTELESLLLGGGLSIAGTALANPSLAGLKELFLNDVEIVEPLPPKFGFQLSKLSVLDPGWRHVRGPYREPFSDDVLALLADATQQRLETFHAGWDGFPEESVPHIDKLMRSLQHAAPHLETLSLPICGPELVPTATTFVSAATKLRELGLCSFFDPESLRILSVLPPSLTSLELEMRDEFPLDDNGERWLLNSHTLNAIHLAVRGAPELRSLNMRGCEVSDWDELEGWPELVEECASKEVALTFDDEPANPEAYLLWRAP